MRIAFVTPEYVTENNFDGGLASHLGRVCPALASRGHEVCVTVFSDGTGRLTQDGVEIHRVCLAPALRRLEWLANRFTLFRLSQGINWMLKSWMLNRTLLRLHRQSPFDIVQFASYTGTAFFRPKGIPSVVRVSSYEPLRQEAYGLPLTADYRMMARLDVEAIRKADAVFGPSRLIADVVTRALGRPVPVIEPPFVVHRGGWDERLYSDLLAGRRYLLFFGTLGVLKGVATIADMIGELLQRHPDLFFVFIGKDVGFEEGPMMQHVWEKAGGQRGRVLYLGKMRHSQLYPIISHAHVVVLPSLIDNLPNSCLEAMALERVVVATKGASFEQLIEDGMNGFLYDRNSPARLLAAIERALGLDAAERSRMGARAAARISELEPSAALGRLVDFYRLAIERRDLRQ